MKVQIPVVFILIGPPGCGKGTQSEFIAEKLDTPQVSTGNLLRDEIKSKTTLGKRLRTIMGKGNLVDDQIVLSLLKKKISGRSCNAGFILDGFPRNIAQAEELEELLSKLKKTFKLVVIDFAVSEREVLNRITNRYYCTKCKTNYNKLYKNPIRENVCDVCGAKGEFAIREDDTEKVVKRRLVECRKQTAPVISYYKKNEILLEVDGDKAIGRVTREIDSKLKKILTY